MTSDELHMARALALAERGRGSVEPNPMVGAVIVRGDSIVGEGCHERFGADHAEIRAIEQAGDRSRGATLYCSLEPCCHHGKTPPCTDAIIRAGIVRVVAAMADPFEKVSGNGVAALRAAGLTVELGVMERQARALNAPFTKLVTTGSPYVHAKWAMTLDGKIATSTGESKWITGGGARQLGHELRGRMDAIVVGINTVLADDPLLTARPPGPRTATRVVLDSAARLPVDSQLVRTANQAPVLVAVSNAAPTRSTQALTELGCECVSLSTQDRGGVSITELLRELGRRRFTNILVEGGGRLLGSFHDADSMDELHVFVAGKTLGGRAPTPLEGAGIARIADARKFEITQVRQVDQDCLIHAARRDPVWS